MRQEQYNARLKQDTSLHFPDRPITFSSRSEMACGLMLEKYVEGFKLKTGETFQVPVANKFIDFKINNTWIEFHPIILRQEFDNPVAFRKFNDATKRLKMNIRHEIHDAVKEELAEKYYRKRRYILQQQEPNPELVVVPSGKDFIKLVLQRFSNHAPDTKKGIREFDNICRQ